MMLSSSHAGAGVGAWTLAGTMGLLWANSLVPAVMGEYTPYLDQVRSSQMPNWLALLNALTSVLGLLLPMDTAGPVTAGPDHR